MMRLRSAVILIAAVVAVGPSIEAQESAPSKASTVPPLSPDPEPARPTPFEFAPTLRQSGFYTDVPAHRIAPGFVPYAVNSPLWTDGALKDRFVRVPEGEAIRFHAEDEWVFPIGTTFLQTLFFMDEGRRVDIETRVIVRGADELQFGSYVWNDEGDDADLTDESGDDVYANHGDVSQLWSVPARDDCAQCHNTNVGVRALGLSTPQWNRPALDGERSQLHAFAARGLLAGVPEDLAGLPRIADPSDESAPLDRRARSYLATNCSACHRPEGEGSGTLDLRYTTPLESTGLLHPERDLLGFGTPRSPNVVARMKSVGWERMPSLLSTVPDDVVGIPLIKAWIASPSSRGEVLPRQK